MMPNKECIQRIIKEIDSQSNQWEKGSNYHREFIEQRLVTLEEVGFGIQMLSPKGNKLYQNSVFQEGYTPSTSLPFGNPHERIDQLIIQIPARGQEELSKLMPMIDSFMTQWQPYIKNFERAQKEEEIKKEAYERTLIKPVN